MTFISKLTEELDVWLNGNDKILLVKSGISSDCDRCIWDSKTLIRPKKRYNKIWIGITSKCNYNCDFCLNNKEIIRELPLKIFIEDVMDIINLTFAKELYISGGEPTTHSFFNEIIKSTSKLNINKTLITNGSLLLNHECKNTLIDSKINIQLSIPNLNNNDYKKLTNQNLDITNHITNIIKEYKLTNNLFVNLLISPLNSDLYLDQISSLLNQGFEKVIVTFLKPIGKAKDKKHLHLDLKKRLGIYKTILQTNLYNDQKVKVSGGVFDNNDYINQLVKPPKFECDLLSEELQIFPSEMVSTCISQEYVEKKVSVQNFRKYLVGQLSNLPLELNNYCYKQPKCNG